MALCLQQTTETKRHQNGYSSVNFTDIELIINEVVEETGPQHII